MIETGRELDGDLQSLSWSNLTPAQAWQLCEHARGLPGLAPGDADGGFTKQPAADGVETATLRPPTTPPLLYGPLAHISTSWSATTAPSGNTRPAVMPKRH